jgi:hypothetical protein
MMVWLAVPLALAIGLSACSSAATSTGASRATPAHSGSAAPSPTATPTPTALPPCIARSAPALAPGGATATGPLWTIASGLNKPDDLLFGDGSLLVGLLGAGTIQVYAPGKETTTLPVHIASVEGMVYIGQDLYAAGQADDAVFQITGSTLRKVIQLSPVRGVDGVDGISAAGDQLLVPDSPHGVVDWVDPASGRITKQVGGFVRPTGVWPARDGSVLVADEFGNAAVRIAPDGSKTYLVRGLPIVDDIAEDSEGNVFVVTPAASGGRLVQLAAGSTRDLADRLAAPQGVVPDAADNLYFSEEDAGRVDLLIRTYKLVPLQPVVDSSTQPVCLEIARAPGFSGDVTLQGSPGLEVVEQPGTGNRGSVLVTGCQSAPCPVTATAGGRKDVLWIQGRSG